MAAKDAVVTADQGDSLWDDAWRRLRKNRMAMAGLWVTIVMTLVAVLADVLMPFDPTREQLWVGALPPNTEILELRNEMRFAVDAVPGRADVPESAHALIEREEPFVLSFDVVEEHVERLAVSMYGPVVRGVRVFPSEGGVRQVSELTVAEGTRLRVRDPLARLDVALLDRPDTWLDVRELVVEEEAPPGFPVRGGAYVVSLESVRVPDGGTYGLDVEFAADGRVTAVSRDGAALSADDVHVLRPQHVKDVRIGGRRLSHTHVLGTDLKGRDSLSRLIYGSRISLLVGITATLVSLVIGVFYGAVSGYAGGRTDGTMMRIVDVLYAIPYLFLVILLLVAFGRSIIILFVALGAVQWLTMARIVRGQVLSLREKEFVDAAITLGTRPWRILTSHLIPNTLGVVVVYTTLTVPAVILQESFLSFLGLTVELDGKPVASWGALVNDGREALGLAGENWWLLLWPSIAMSLTLFSLNFLGDGLRDAFDPQQRGRT